MTRLNRLGACVVAAWCLLAGTAGAQNAPPPEDEPRVVTRWSFKGTGLFSRAPDLAELFPERVDATGLWRARVETTARLSSRLSASFAYEHRLRLSSSTSGSGLASALPSDAPPPYRLTPLDWEVAGGSHGAWRHEIDRAAVDVALGKVRLSAGRQAIGWGRGVVFGAIDLFAPFSPLEADREWRRGVDAVHADIAISREASIDLVAALAGRADESAFGGRLRGFVSGVDLQVVGGRRAGDPFGGVATSGTIGGAEFHGEVALFRTSAVSGSELFGRRRDVVKAVIGGSSRLPVGSGVLVFVEYHYSGFGSPHDAAFITSVADPGFAPRLLRGDTQLLTRHAVAVVATYEQSPLTSWTVTWIQQPVDGSGVVSPSVTLTFGDRASILATGYLAYGATALGTRLATEYGATPTAALLQFRFYR